MIASRKKRRWLLWLGIPLCIVVALILAGFLLPSHQHIERSVVIQGSSENVFGLIATMQRWPDWTAWTTNRFPDMTVGFAGPASGVGAMMIAAGQSSGDGTVKIIAADPNSGIEHTLDFNHGQQEFIGGLHYTNTPTGLQVSWTLDADLGSSPLRRWMGVAMERLMSGDMEHGLEKLKRRVETPR